MKQTETILNHMRTHGSITTRTAYEEYGITRLSARIWDLRHEGHEIEDETIKVPTRTGEETTVKKYWIKPEPVQGTLFPKQRRYEPEVGG